MVQVFPLYAVAAGAAFPHLSYAAGLNTAAKAIGLDYFGTATDNVNLDDTQYKQKLGDTQDFGQLTPGNSQKWDTTEPSEGSFNFEDGDVIADLAEENGQLLRCHTLVWYNQLPSWVEDGSWTNETLTKVMKNHITNVVEHYKGQCYAWDVVNEAVDDDGKWRDNVFYNTIGPSYIPIAFEAAAAADPDAKLYYNDYNIEYSGDKADLALEIVKSVQDYGAKIDGVGLQGHLIVGSMPDKSDIKKTIARYTDLGLEVAFTEVDIRMDLPKNEEKLAQQSTDYQALVEACVETKNCTGFTIWDYTDKYSWVPDTFPGTGAALPWDDELNKKPAYDGILTALGGSNSTDSVASKLSSRRTRRGALGQPN